MLKVEEREPIEAVGSTAEELAGVGASLPDRAGSGRDLLAGQTSAEEEVG